MRTPRARGIAEHPPVAQRRRRWYAAAPFLLALALCAASCGSDAPRGEPTVRPNVPSPVATVVHVVAASPLPSATAPTRDFDGTVKGDGSEVLVRRSADSGGAAIGACADGAHLHLGDRSTDGRWLSLAWDPGNPPAGCYPFSGHERDGRSTAYIGSALITPLLLAPGQATASPRGASTGSPVAETAVPPPDTPTPSIPSSPPTARPTPTVGAARTSTAVRGAYSLDSASAPSCTSAADGQFLIRWVVSDAGGQLLSGLTIAVSGPDGQTVPAAVRTGAAAGSEVGTALVGAAGSYHLAGSMPNPDGSSASVEASVVCGGGLTGAASPTPS